MYGEKTIYFHTKQCKTVGTNQNATIIQIFFFSLSLK